MYNVALTVATPEPLWIKELSQHLCTLYNVIMKCEGGQKKDLCVLVCEKFHLYIASSI